MADLTPSSGKITGVKRSTRNALPKVDLTAMVDLAFLLITFFLLTTSLSKPAAMEMFIPVKAEEPMPFAEDRTMTLCLGEKNRMFWYMGLPDEMGKSGVITPPQLRKVFMQQSKNVRRATGKHLLLIIKPDSKSNYKNLVDVLDEVAITDIKTYSIADITAEDKFLMHAKNMN